MTIAVGSIIVTAVTIIGIEHKEGDMKVGGIFGADEISVNMVRIILFSILGVSFLYCLIAYRVI